MIEIYQQLRRQRWLLIAGVVLGVLGAAAAWLVHPPGYTATAQLYVSSPLSNGNTSAAYEGAQVSEERTKSFAELATSDRVLSAVVGQLNLRTSTAQLADQVHATSESGSVLLTIDVTDRDPQQAADIANAVARDLPPVVKDVETNSTGGVSSSVVARPVDVVDTPTGRNFPSFPISLFLGVLGGLLVSSVAGVTRHYLKPLIYTESDLATAAGATSLGSLPFSNSGDLDWDSIAQDPQSPYAEAIRQIRTNMTFAAAGRATQTIVVSSPAQADGRSTICSALIQMYSSLGQKTLLIDADLRHRKDSGQRGVNGPPVGLTELTSGATDLGAAVQRSDDPNVSLLGPGAHVINPAELLTSQNFVNLIHNLRARFDTIIFDSSALLEFADADNLSLVADGFVLVARSGYTSRRDARQASLRLARGPSRVLGTIVNSVDRRDSVGDVGRYGSYYRTAS